MYPHSVITVRFETLVVWSTTRSFFNHLAKNPFFVYCPQIRLIFSDPTVELSPAMPPAVPASKRNDVSVKLALSQPTKTIAVFRHVLFNDIRRIYCSMAIHTLQGMCHKEDQGFLPQKWRWYAHKTWYFFFILMARLGTPWIPNFSFNGIHWWAQILYLRSVRYVSAWFLY